MRLPPHPHTSLIPSNIPSGTVTPEYHSTFRLIHRDGELLLMFHSNAGPGGGANYWSVLLGAEQNDVQSAGLEQFDIGAFVHRTPPSYIGCFLDMAPDRPLANSRLPTRRSGITSATSSELEKLSSYFHARHLLKSSHVHPGRILPKHPSRNGFPTTP